MPIYKFSPNLASAEERELTFVARDAVLEDLLDRARKIESGAQHCILIGPRGIGKTHLLLLLRDRIKDDEFLALQWEVIQFSEEEYSITSLAELFLRVIDLLPVERPENIGRDVDLALGYIMDFSKTSGKRLLLLMDNIHLYFNQFPDTDIGRLRDILMSKSEFLIIGAAPSYFKQMTGYEESLYNFFEPIHLNELVHGEVWKMLERRAKFEGNQDLLAKLNECQQEIRTITHLTGGNPRLILMLYQVMCECDVMKAAEAFKQLLDELTPYFQGRMDGLPPQGRKVLDTLASMEAPSTPTELAEEAGMQVNAVTSQLKRLKDGGYVQQVKRQRGKTTRYEVTERLFRMWREMRTQPGRERLDFLIRFLNLWYTATQLLDEIERVLTHLPQARRYEEPELLSHLKYLTEATPTLLRRELERVYSHAKAGRLEAATAEILPLRELAGYKEAVEANPDDAMAWYSLGKALDRLSRHQEALESFDKATQLQRDLVCAWISRGLVLVSLDRYKEALESFYKVTQPQTDEAEKLGIAEAQISALKELIGYTEDVKADPNNAVVWFNRGMLLLNLERNEEALESYDKAIQLRYDGVETWSNRGVALTRLGRHEEALENFDRAVELQPDLADVWSNRGGPLFRLGKHEEALESYSRAVELKPNDEEFWYNRALVLIKLKRYEEALENYDRAIQIQPGLALVWGNRGWLLNKFGRDEEALQSLDKAVQLQPNDAVAWHNRAVSLVGLGRSDEALESHDRAAQLQPDSVEIWMSRGSTLIRLGRYEEALESLNKAIGLQPGLVGTWFGRGMALERLGRYEEALEDLNKAVRLQPDLAAIQSNRGLVLAKLGRYEEALGDYDRSIQLQPDDAHVWADRSATLYNLDRYEEALKSSNRAVELKPSSAYVRNGRAGVFGKLRRYREALEDYSKAVELQPDDAVLWSNRGWALNNLRRHKEALQSCNRATRLDPNNAMVWINRGVALVNLSKHDEGLGSLKKAVELASAQGLEYASEFTALLTADTELLDSLGNLREDNLGSARRSLANAVGNGKQADSGDFRLVLFGYLKDVLKSGNIEFVQEAIEIIVSELGEEYGELLRPFSLALDYMQTEDESILERLQQEVRALVLEIVEYAKS